MAEVPRILVSGELVPGSLDLSITCTYDMIGSHEQMVIRFGEEENIRYSS